MSIFVTFGKMMMILFAISMGFLANRLGYLSEEINRKLTKLVMNITMPCMFLGSVLTGDALPDTATILSVLKVAALFYGLELVFVLILPPLIGGTPMQKGVWRLACFSPNNAFIGYPVVAALFGEGAVFYAVLLCLPYNVLNYTLSPAMLNGKTRFSWKVFCTPILISSVISLIIALTGFSAPALVGESFALVGDVTVPLSLLVLGSVLAGMPVKRVFSEPRMLIVSAVRLLLQPLALLALLRLLGVEGLILSVAVIEMAMPAAVNSVMPCLEYDGDVDTMAQTVFVSTVLSMVTIPLVAALL